MYQNYIEYYCSEKMNTKDPYMLIHSDGSISLLECKEAWSQDPDLYCWREDKERMIDSELRVLVPASESSDTRVFEDAWITDEKRIEIEELRKLVKSYIDQNNGNDESVTNSLDFEDLSNLLRQTK